MLLNSKEAWVIYTSIENSIKAKINKIGTPLKEWNVSINFGIKTGYNSAFIISTAKKDELIELDPKSADLIRPILRGRDIQRYTYEFADLWLISTFPSRKYNIDDYKSIKEHLLSFGKEKLEQIGAQRIVNGKVVKSRKKTNNKWFETQDSISYWNDLSKQKIIWGEISDKPKFALDLSGQFTPEATTFMMTGKHLKYLLCFLNSKLSEYFFAKIGTTTGMGTLRWKKYLIETLPVPKIESSAINEFETIVDKLYSDNINQKRYETLIDSKIYSIFGFNTSEIEFIEDSIINGAH